MLHGALLHRVGKRMHGMAVSFLPCWHSSITKQFLGFRSVCLAEHVHRAFPLCLPEQVFMYNVARPIAFREETRVSRVSAITTTDVLRYSLLNAVASLFPHVHPMYFLLSCLTVCWGDWFFVIFRNLLCAAIPPMRCPWSRGFREKGIPLIRHSGPPEFDSIPDLNTTHAPPFLLSVILVPQATEWVYLCGTPLYWPYWCRSVLSGLYSNDPFFSDGLIMFLVVISWLCSRSHGHGSGLRKLPTTSSTRATLCNAHVPWRLFGPAGRTGWLVWTCYVSNAFVFHKRCNLPVFALPISLWGTQVEWMAKKLEEPQLYKDCDINKGCQRKQSLLRMQSSKSSSRNHGSRTRSERKIFGLIAPD